MSGRIPYSAYPCLIFLLLGALAAPLPLDSASRVESPLASRVSDVARKGRGPEAIDERRIETGKRETCAIAAPPRARDARESGCS